MSHPSDQTRSRAGLKAVLACLAILAVGCGEARQPERDGAEALREIPGDVSALLPEGVVLCHRERLDDPAPYELWILRRPGEDRLKFPRKLKGLESHDMPSGALERLLAAKAPGLDPGSPPGGVMRFSHWEGRDAEYQVREMVTDRGWFASVERLPP